MNEHKTTTANNKFFEFHFDQHFPPYLFRSHTIFYIAFKSFRFCLLFRIVFFEFIFHSHASSLGNVVFQHFCCFSPNSVLVESTFSYYFLCNVVFKCIFCILMKCIMDLWLEFISDIHCCDERHSHNSIRIKSIRFKTHITSFLFALVNFNCKKKEKNLMEVKWT